MNTPIFFCFLFASLTSTKCDLWNEQLPTITTQTDNFLKLQENFTELQINGLTETLHYETLSKLQNVSKLKISNNYITQIEHGAICSSPNLRTLHLSFAGNPEAPDLTKDMFRQCHHQLVELYLRFDFDRPSKIEEDALEKLYLQSLGLQCYPIKTVGKNFLKLNQSTLKRLILSNCHIHSIESTAFEDMINLEEIEISYNRQLRRLPENLFVKNRKLKRLWLQYNRIKELNWSQFEDLLYLEDLNLSGNRLTYFSAQEIAEILPNLRRLDIRKNLWPCKLKEAFANDLEARRNNSIEVVYATNVCKK